MNWFLLVTFALSAHAQNAKPIVPNVGLCVEKAKFFTRAGAFADADSEKELTQACEGVDQTCVGLVSDNLRSSERYEKEQMLPIVKACKGTKIAPCYRTTIAGLASFDYSTNEQALALLKKCELAQTP